LYKKNNKKREILQKYQYYLAKCYEQIDILDDEGYIDTIFNIPELLDSFRFWSQDDCLSFIKKKLKKDYFDVRQIDSGSLYISWQYLEDNIKKDTNNNKINIAKSSQKL
jgi:hypothetical protein